MRGVEGKQGKQRQGGMREGRRKEWEGGWRGGLGAKARRGAGKEEKRVGGGVERGANSTWKQYRTAASPSQNPHFGDKTT